MLSTRNGLPQDVVNHVVTDSAGFLWVATQGGVARWDGYRAVALTGPDNMLTNTSVSRLSLENEEALWISTYSSGIYRYEFATGEYSQMVNIPYRQRPDWAQYANSFKWLNNDTVLIGMAEEVIRFHTDTATYEVLYSLSDASLERAESIRRVDTIAGTLLIATTHNLYSKPLSESGKVTPVDYLNGVEPDVNTRNVKLLMQDNQQRFWVGTVGGLFMAPVAALTDYLAGQGENPFTQILSEHNTWDMVQNNADSFWLGTSDGLFQLSRQEGGWQAEHILEPSNGFTELSKKHIKTLTKDDNGNLWLGSEYGGALYFQPQGVSLETLQNRRYQASPLLSNNTVWALHQSDSDTLWIGTDNGLNRYQFSTGESEQFLVSTDTIATDYESIIEKIFPWDERHLLLQTFDGLRLFSIEDGTVSLPPVAEGGDQTMFQSWNFGSNTDTQGRIYFIADAFYRYSPQTLDVEKLALDPAVFDVDFFSGFLGTSPHYENQIMVAMLDGVWLIDTRTLEHTLVYAFPESQRNNEVSVSAFAVDGDNTLWLAFPRFGLLGLDATTFEQKVALNSDNKLPSDIVYSLQPDALGGLWFSSHSGLHRYAPATDKLKNFRYGRQLFISEFNEGAVTTLSDGRLAFGSTNGVVMFNPESLLSATSGADSASRMTITAATLNSRDWALPLRALNGDKLDLHHDDYGITVYFSPMVMGNKSDARYTYKLLRDNSIVSEGTTRDARLNFASLEPGFYTLTVAPTSNSFDATFIPADISIAVPYPPLRSPLAYATYALIALGLLLAYLFTRQQQLNRLARAQQQVRLFGDAFRQTRDWVIIFDADKTPVAANPAFAQAFGIAEHGNLKREMNQLYRRYPKLSRVLLGHLAGLSPGQFWKDEDSIDAADGRNHDVLIEITAVRDEENAERTDHYLLVISDISDQKRAERKLIKIANYDSLTGLVNRSLLLDRLEHAVANAKAHDTKVAVLFVDLDRFKGINDSLGHDYGDKLLKVVANRMRNLAAEADTVARLGGDEFVLVIEEVKNLDILSHFVQELIESVETPISLGKEVLRVSCSVGVSFYPDDAAEPAELLKQADVAMYSAKKDTLNGFTYFTTEMNERARHRLHLENRVKKAFTEDCFYNQYQPIINARSGAVEGVELLLRCKMADEPLYPDAFIPILEQLRYIIEVTRQAMRRAVSDLAQWYQQGFNGYVSVNLSALHFKTEFDIDGIRALLEEFSLPVSSLRFEITEGVLMDNTGGALRQIQRLVEAGFVLALDDFGTGYSSLSYLKRYPLSVLKIDKSFVDGIQPGNEDDALVATTINLARSLSMTCVAEGIETQAQARQLLMMGCDRQQGYHFSRPVDAEAIPALIDQSWCVASDPEAVARQSGG
ncbi:EAL domain-containing protein [Alteromonas sp. ASW11-19]|uniref:EAL domain-containing protein n=1 Tax=Alteromonas salexigens TaxID=2982530 RepID=A0ABT2VR80_9ALTE|nr:EAL domain-containing protein [Alteromonas salexigens]MCU7555832.1 EAL domain-containing protein [Alteromonas salexigens]